jgi:AcrR family transcriptional regulator
LTVAQIIAAAGVSRPTFYEHFTDREDGMLVALEPLRERLYAQTRAVICEHEPAAAAASLTGALTRFAASDSATAQMLFCEPLSAGRRALEAHDQMVATLADLIEDAHARLPATVAVTELAPRVLVGTVVRILAQRLSGGETPPPALARELASWLTSYERPIGEHRRRTPSGESRTVRRSPSGAMTLYAPLHPAARPGRIVRGRHAERQRLRILAATAVLVSRAGYENATVVQIAGEAGLDTHAFYALFADKHDAFAACGEMLFRQLIAVSAGDFAAGARWPERVRHAIAAFLAALQADPALTRAVLVDGRVAGVRATRRVHAGACALTIYLQEGFRDDECVSKPSELALEAIAAAGLEACYEQLRRDPPGGLPALLDEVAFVALAPFLGASRTDDLLCGRATETPCAAFTTAAQADASLAVDTHPARKLGS